MVFRGRTLRGKEDRNERLKKSSTCKMGMQVSCCDFAEISQESDIWEDSAKDWRNSSRIMSACGCGIGRKKCSG